MKREIKQTLTRTLFPIKSADQTNCIGGMGHAILVHIRRVNLEEHGAKADTVNLVGQDSTKKCVQYDFKFTSEYSGAEPCRLSPSVSSILISSVNPIFNNHINSDQIPYFSLFYPCGK